MSKRCKISKNLNMWTMEEVHKKEIDIYNIYKIL